MWYVAAAEPGAELYVGLNPGVTRAHFERSIQTGNVADCFHRIPVKAGDAMFLPSGRVHAIGAGLVIFEIQQNSDTTYRVFDWNRVGLDGKPRDLHIAESLASIDFNDYQPPLLTVAATTQNGLTTRRLVTHPLFVVDHLHVQPGTKLPVTSGEFQVIGTILGEVEIKSEATETLRRAAGEFCLLPASAGNVELVACVESQFLVAKPGVH
jgi:mannose-6-phosphate isomerase